MQRGSSVCNKALLKMGEILLTVDVWEKKHDRLKTKILTMTIKGFKRWQTKQLWFANHSIKGICLAETYVDRNRIFKRRVLYLPYQFWQLPNAQRLEPAAPRLEPKPCSDHTKGQRTWWSDYLLSKKKKKKSANLELTWLQLKPRY